MFLICADSESSAQATHRSPEVRGRVRGAGRGRAVDEDPGGPASDPGLPHDDALRGREQHSRSPVAQDTVAGREKHNEQRRARACRRHEEARPRLGRSPQVQGLPARVETRIRLLTRTIS